MTAHSGAFAPGSIRGRNQWQDANRNYSRSEVVEGKGKAMSYSISTLLTRNLHDVFGENDGTRRRAAIDEIYTEDCVFYDPQGVYRGRDEIDRVAGEIKATHPDFRYQPIVGPRNWAMVGGSNGYRAALVRRQLTPGLISSLPGTAGLPPFICFFEPESAVLCDGKHRPPFSALPPAQRRRSSPVH
jgi:hypothetical protein